MNTPFSLRDSIQYDNVNLEITFCAASIIKNYIDRGTIPLKNPRPKLAGGWGQTVGVSGVRALCDKAQQTGFLGVFLY